MKFGLLNKIKYAQYFVAILAFSLVQPVFANEASVIKAAFIEKLSRFIEWPDKNATIQQQSNFLLCVIDQDTLDGALDDLAEASSIKNQPLRIQYLNHAEDAKECNALFISNTMSAKLNDTLLQLDDRPILTIGDSAEYAKQGVMINFYIEEGRLSFEVNIEAAKSAGFKISSRVLKLARIIDGEA